MKKILAIVLVAVLALCVCACAKTEATNNDATGVDATATDVDATAEDADADFELADVEVMTAEEFAAAEVDALVCVETYVQAKQGWWDNTLTLYTQNEEAGYFIYNMACSEEEAEALVPGTKIKVAGYKAEWSGEIEIADAKYEIIADADSFVAEAKDVTAVYGTDELAASMNTLVAVKGAKVVAKNDDGAAYVYKWDGSGEQGDDIYFDVEINGEVYTLTVESYLCGADTEVYKAVEALEVDQVIDVEGFLYWYEGAQPHVTAVTVAG